jgi:NADH dehydrogenase FAD-containing subunit
MTATVAVVGGGYGGIAVAKALDEIADVCLIEPRETFVHNVAALRAVTDPDWIGRLFLPYSRLLARGRVIRDRAARVDAGSVTLGSGGQIEVDYIILATGSRYPFPAKLDLDEALAASAKLHTTHQALARAGHVLLLGAGPVGLELAGEIKAAWPEKSVTIVDPAHDILAGAYPDEFRAELHSQLAALGVTLILGTSLATELPSGPGVAQTFTATTQNGTAIAADIWFRCYGVEPVTDYLAADLQAARQADGHLRVTDELWLPGHPAVFAIGDITAIPEAKKAQAAAAHAQVVATNISSLIRGKRDQVSYQPHPPSISIPLGPAGGASYAPHAGVVNAETTARLKGADLMIPAYAQLLGLPEPAGQEATR